MKRQSSEVYGYGASLRTAKRLPSAKWVLAIVIAGMLAGAYLP